MGQLFAPPAVIVRPGTAPPAFTHEQANDITADVKNTIGSTAPMFAQRLGEMEPAVYNAQPVAARMLTNRANTIGQETGTNLNALANFAQGAADRANAQAQYEFALQQSIANARKPNILGSILSSVIPYIF